MQNIFVYLNVKFNKRQRRLVYIDNGINPPEHIAIIYTSNNIVYKHMKQKLTDLSNRLFSVIVEDFSTPLSIMATTTR